MQKGLANCPTLKLFLKVKDGRVVGTLPLVKVTKVDRGDVLHEFGLVYLIHKNRCKVVFHEGCKDDLHIICRLMIAHQFDPNIVEQSIAKDRVHVYLLLSIHVGWQYG